MASDGGKLCRCGCCGCLTVLVIILFAVSWSSLEYQEYGLDCNGIRNTVDPVRQTCADLLWPIFNKLL
jgi:hypothetical protein